jgi:hypothetical protein
MKNSDLDSILKAKLSRRSALRGLGALGVSPLVLRAGKGDRTDGPARDASPGASRCLSAGNPVLHSLASGKLIADFDMKTGTIHSITGKNDPLGTNFLGNRLNTRGVALGDAHWSGDLVATVWHLATPDWIREQSDSPSASFPPSGEWRRESTLDSDDTRIVSFDASSFRVRYKGRSQNVGGIQSFGLALAYSFAADGSLLWDIEIENTGDRTLELGELAFPLRVNDDYGGLYEALTPRRAILEGKMQAIQKAIHEQKVFAHAFVAGHSSYVLVQRPRGDGPFLMLCCEEDTSFECIYKVEGSFPGSWIGTDLLAIHSWAVHQQRNWIWNPWVNGHTSLILEPGRKRSFRLRFAFIDDYSMIGEELVKSGNLGIRVLPAMVVQENTDVRVEIKSRADLDAIEIHSDGVLLKERKRRGEATLVTLSFEGRGQKSLKLIYGGGRWTYLHFYCIEDADLLIKARARFMARRQFYENPKDSYDRNHVFLPFDYRLGRMIDDYEDVWEVGGTGDPGFGDPLFLSEKNVYYPCREEIEKLETYVDDCLFRHIQNPETYEVRDSLYWKDRYPSSPSSSFSKKRSEATWRTYNYTFVANIYHALYRIGKRYDLLAKRTWADYLMMAYRTCLKWFTTGPFKHAGLITGSNAIEILADLESEGRTKESATLMALMKECHDEFIRDPYPYSSEIEIDETGQHQVYFFSRFFAARGVPGSREKKADVVRVMKALRGGDQPVWFGYGNDLFAHPDLRGQIACWHSESLNGLALLADFEETGDPAALQKGYSGVMSVMHNVLPDGMGYAWFMLSPGVFGSEPPRTFEGGLGLWGFLRAAKAYVVDDQSFGLVGYGCELETTADEIRVFPKDGVKKRVRFVAQGIDIEAATAEITSAALSKKSGGLVIRLADSTGLVKIARLAIRGLRQGEYEVRVEGAMERRDVKDVLDLALPIGRARTIGIRRI